MFQYQSIIAFHCKIIWENIFEATSYNKIILIFFSNKGMAVSMFLVYEQAIVWSCHTIGEESTLLDKIQ